MGGLFDAIPGLAAHRVEPCAVAEFDTVRAGRLILEASSMISSLYPTGAMEWLAANRSEVVGYLQDAEREVDAAALAGDLARLVRSLELWTAAHKKAFTIFTERPPVIERDGVL